MDDLLVHSREREHMDRVLDMLKALVEHGIEAVTKEVSILQE